jgi:hypothetical protein
MKLLLYSATENGFWSNKDGWVREAVSATVFTRAQAKAARFPVVKGNDAIWVKYDAQLLCDDDGPLRELNDLEALEYAKEQYHCDGEIEVDIPTKSKDRAASVSRGGETGTYVRAYVWIYWPDAEIEEVDLS